jgi:hypothetical protein
MTFRMWCQEKWFEHKDELDFYKQGSPYSAAEYFARYKYWLKREYKFQKEKQ